MKKSWIIALLVILALTAVGPTLAQDGDEIAFLQGVVNADVLAVRGEADIAAEVLGTVDHGEVVDVLEVDGLFAHVRYDDLEGYAFAADLDISPAPLNLDGTANTSTDLAVRADRMVSADVLTTVPGGGHVGVLLVDGLWALVYTGDAIGWVFAADIDLGEDNSYASNFLQDTADADVRNELALRAEPAISADVVTTIPADEVVSVLYYSDDGLFGYVWYHGQGGWAFAADLHVTQPRALGTGTTNQARLNFRSAPDTSDNYNIIAQLPLGAEVLLLGQTEDGTFLNVRYDGEAGWVSTDFVDSELDLTTLPVTG